MMIAEGRGGFPWGLLVVADADSDFATLPDEPERDVPLVAGEDAIVCRVAPAVFDDVTVRVWRDAPGPALTGPPMGAAPIAVPSGRLVIGDVERESPATMTVHLPPGHYDVEAYFDEPDWPEAVDLVLRTSSS
ncbi:hypothetical protein [Dactylosporangium sp. NPDC049140]|jgi:hypothetical protein|uniref:hypothetical protein n=1 Tax=Dactylosporangium sp. NPDC049140 TaxID=3155647 RepID=UPI0033F96782